MADDPENVGDDARGDDGNGETAPAIDWEQRAIAAEERVADLEAVARHHLGDDVELDAWMDEALTFRRDGTPVVTAPKGKVKSGESKDDGEGAPSGDAPSDSSSADGSTSPPRRRPPRRPEPTDDKPKDKTGGRLDRDRMSHRERFEQRHALAAQDDADAAQAS